MQDSVTINSIDTANEANGYVIANVTITVNGTSYTPSPGLTIQGTDVANVVSGITQQAESFRQQVLATQAKAANAMAAPDLSSLDGEVIDL